MGLSVGLFSVISIFLISSRVNAQATNDTLATHVIINKVINALGGKEYLQSIKTLYTDTKTELDGREVHYIVKEMFPNKGSFEIVYNNHTIYRSWFNGKEGFESSNGKVKKTDPDKFKDKKFKKNIFNEFDYLDSTLWRLELDGEEVIDEDTCFKIKGTFITGFVKNIYYSKKTFLERKSEKMLSAEANRYSATLYSKYKRFNDLNYFTEIRFIDKDGKMKTGTIENLKINQGIKESDFR
ncbi:MAG: hypothetical protein EOO43_06075 [Flavobacterium sp.]|nr:MAG: hypothetical protein EOO43_06075 [Flavobacterium sp.]